MFYRQVRRDMEYAMFFLLQTQRKRAPPCSKYYLIKWALIVFGYLAIYNRIKGNPDLLIELQEEAVISGEPEAI